MFFTKDQLSRGYSILLAAALTCTSTMASAQKALPANAHANVDIRTTPSAAQSSVRNASAAALSQNAAKNAAAVTKALNTLKARVPDVSFTTSPLTGGIEVLDATNFLTPPAPGRSGKDIVLDFYAQNLGLFGLTEGDYAGLNVIGESVSPSGLRMVRIEQTINGLPVFQSETRVTLTADGRIVRVVGRFVPNALASVSADADLISAQAALATALASVSVTVAPASMTLANTNANGTKTEVLANSPNVEGKVVSQLVYFPSAPGVLVPAWSQVSYTADGGSWYTLVDAGANSLLWRKNISSHAITQDARFSVYVQADGTTPADNPAPLSPTTVTPGSGTQGTAIARTDVNMFTAMNVTASPDGWIADGGTTTTGNNTDTYLDLNNSNAPNAGILDNNGRPTGNLDVNTFNRDFLGTGYVYTPPPSGGNPEAGSAPTDIQHRRGIATQLFYITNWYHDQLFALGFNPAAGNFQANNFAGGGLGNDRVLAEAQDSVSLAATGANRNNANFSTPPDGQSGRMQMYIFTGPTIDRDGSLDAEIVIHELTHGLSNRLIGNGAGLNWDIGGGMGEGWSDFYALSLLNKSPTDNPDSRYAAGSYATYKLAAPSVIDNYLYGIRRFPYCTDNAVSPLTWADVDQTTFSTAGGITPSPLNFSGNGALEVHNIGEIWCNTLWEVRSRIINDPAVGAGNIAAGNTTTLLLITDALKLTPIDPSFVEARDAIILADIASTGGLNEQSIWAGFADRGLGYNAVAPNKFQWALTSSHMGVKESFDLPYLDVAATTVDDSIGNNNGVLDPNEPANLTVQLKNPWRKASKGVASATAVLTSSTPGVVINNGNSNYGAIAAQASVNGTPFQITIPNSATAGQLLNFTITVTSSLGTKAVNFTKRVGTPGGAGAPVTLTRTANLAIPDNSPPGATDTFTVAQDLDIMDLNFRIDSLTHTWVGDVTVMLKGPSGYGTELISGIGAGASSNGNGGDNFTNMVMDDQAVTTGLINNTTSAPFTGSWQPMFNDTAWDAFFNTHDPVGQLSRFNGTSSLGDWKVVVSDQAATDTGTLVSWSLIITPRTYTATPYVAPVATPEIVVEQPLASDVPDGGTRGFGSVAAGSNASLTFTIKNIGTGDLTGLTISKDGADNAMFSVTASPTAPVAGPSGFTTFTVQFAPTSTGPKTAAIHIANNDSDENPFDINLTGTGACPTITVNNPATTTGTLSLFFSQAFTQTGGFGTTTFSTVSPLPTGLSLNNSNGVLSGTPSQSGTFPITVKATDSLTCTGTSSTYTLLITAPPTVTAAFGGATLPAGGTTTLTFTITNPNATLPLTGVAMYEVLPAGLFVANPNGLTSTAGGTVVATSGTNVINLTGGTLAAGGAATISLKVASNVLGLKTGMYSTATSTEAPLVSNPGEQGANPLYPVLDISTRSFARQIFAGSLTVGDPTQTGRMNRFAVASQIGTQKTYPGDFTTTGSRLYDSYSIPNPTAVPQDVQVWISGAGSTATFNAAYLGSFNPVSLSTNYLADAGSSFPTVASYGFTIPAGQTAILIVHEVNVGTGGDYVIGVNTPIPSTPALVAALPSVTVVAAPAPTITSSSAPLLNTATTMTITGTNFDGVTPGNNTVVFTPAGTTGTVTASTATSLTVTSLAGLVVGNLSAVVTTNGQNSGAPVQVATVTTAGALPVATSTGGQIASGEGAPNGAGSATIGTWDTLRTGAVLAANGTVGFRANLLVGSGAPPVTNLDFQGIWKDDAVLTALKGRSGSIAPGVSNGVWDQLPINPWLASDGRMTFGGLLRTGSGSPAVSSSNDGGVWTELGDGTLKLLLREGDSIPGIASFVVDLLPQTVVASSPLGNAAFTIRMRNGALRTTAVVRADVSGGGVVALNAVATQGGLAPAIGGGNLGTFYVLNGNFTDPRMNDAGNIAFAATLNTGGGVTGVNDTQGVWFQASAASGVVAVARAGATAPGTSGAKFTAFERPSISDGGAVAFRGFIDNTGDNVAGNKSQGIWASPNGTAASLVPVIRTGDTGISGMPVGATVASIWSPFSSKTGKLAFRASIIDGGIEKRAIFTNNSGTMKMLYMVGSAVPDLAGETFDNFDHPVIGDAGHLAFTASTNAAKYGIWKETVAASNTPTLLMKVGDSVTTAQGVKPVASISVPGTGTSDRIYEQEVIDTAGEMLIFVTYGDASQGILISP